MRKPRSYIPVQQVKPGIGDFRVPHGVRRGVVAVPQNRRRRVPDGAGIGSRSDVFIQGFAQRERERVKSVVQAVFTVVPVKKDIPFPSLEFSPSPVETGCVSPTGVRVLVVRGHEFGLTWAECGGGQVYRSH